MSVGTYRILSGPYATPERRQAERDESDIWTDYQRIYNRAMNRGQEIKRLQADVERLTDENRELRAKLHDRERFIALHRYAHGDEATA